MTGKPALLKWATLLIMYNYPKFEANIFSKDRDNKTKLILIENSKNRAITMSKNFEGYLLALPVRVPLLIVSN